MENFCSSEPCGWPLEPDSFCLSLLKRLGISDIVDWEFVVCGVRVWVSWFWIRAIYVVCSCCAPHDDVQESGVADHDSIVLAARASPEIYCALSKEHTVLESRLQNRVHLTQP